MKIQIKKHTPVRRPKSRYLTETRNAPEGTLVPFYNYSMNQALYGKPLTDLSVGLENPLELGWRKTYSGTWQLDKPKQPLHKRLTKLFKRRNK